MCGCVGRGVWVDGALCVGALALVCACACRRGRVCVWVLVFVYFFFFFAFLDFCFLGFFVLVKIFLNTKN